MRLYLILGFLLFLLACNGKQERYREINEEQLKLQVILPKNSEQQYSVRVFPGEEIKQAKGSNSREMLYQCDSCFYLQTNGIKQYASSTTPISSGISGCYEYMVYFENGETKAASFVFDDKFYTQKQYSISLEE